MAKEKFKTFEGVFDDFTYRNLFKMMSQGYFEGIRSPLSIGKEANIFSAPRKDGTIAVIKIYRLETCDFNRMYDYIKYDPRFFHVKPHKRKVIFAWAQREYKNLLKAREAGVSVPTVYAAYYNILVMEMVGGMQPAPKLQHAVPEDIKAFAADVIKNMKKLHKAGLVHGDLSSFNILNNDGKPVFIDFSQCSPIESVRAKEFLLRDCTNMAKFFTKYGYKITGEKIERMVTGKGKL